MDAIQRFKKKHIKRKISKFRDLQGFINFDHILLNDIKSTNLSSKELVHLIVEYTYNVAALSLHSNSKKTFFSLS